jgi:ribosomal protein L7/L12
MFNGAPAYASPMMIEEMIKNRKPRTCDIFLREVGPNKIEVIKLLRIPVNVFGGGIEYHRKTTKQLTLGEAKKLAETPLSLIYEDIHHYDAQEIKKEFEKLGAKIDLVVTEWDY